MWFHERWGYRRPGRANREGGGNGRTRVHREWYLGIGDVRRGGRREGGRKLTSGGRGETGGGVSNEDQLRADI